MSRTNILTVKKAIGAQRLTASLKYTDNLSDPDNLETLQRLPTISLDTSRTAVPGTPFYFTNDSSYTYFSRKTGWRAIAWISCRGFMADQPGAMAGPGAHGRIRGNGLLPTQHDRPDHNYRLNTGSFITPVGSIHQPVPIYDIGGKTISKHKHRIQPEMTFSFISARDQADLPKFDSLDRRSQKQVIRYGVVNYLVAKVMTDPWNPAGKGFLGGPPRGLLNELPPALDTTSDHDILIFLRFGVGGPMISWKTGEPWPCGRPIYPRIFAGRTAPGRSSWRWISHPLSGSCPAPHTTRMSANLPKPASK